MRKPSFCRYFIGTSEGVPGVRHLYCVTHVSGHVTGDVMCLTCRNEAQFECLYSSVLMSPSNNAYIQVREALKNKNLVYGLWDLSTVLVKVSFTKKSDLKLNILNLYIRTVLVPEFPFRWFDLSRTILC